MKIALQMMSINPKFWVTASQEAEAVGFESVWVPEHLVFPVEMSGSPYTGHPEPPIPPSMPAFDVWVTLSMIAQGTSTIRLGTDVYNIGLRHPFITARAVTTLDVLSGGRVEFGIGASWLKEEWDATGLDFPTRGRRIDETIDVCRRLWT
jgi:alkanesulfonate monooxygenase SsuD/methylene tetrahydromethanopterin reductase-like flavin-dependent oxidoreductase (luciferase family)